MTALVRFDLKTEVQIGKIELPILNQYSDHGTDP